MKNFKKLLVTLLALVLLVSGAVVVSLAASTPAEVIADARDLLDQAMQEDAPISTRSEKMRELDRLIDTNLVNIKNSQEWRDFQVGYRAAQLQLREECVAQAAGFLDRLMDKTISSKDAEELFSGLEILVATTGDGRGYFDLASADFTELSNRLKAARAIAKLQEAEDAVLASDKGAALLWVNTYKNDTLSQDEAAMATEEYAMIDGWFAEVYANVKGELYSAVTSRTAEAILATTPYARAMVLAEEIEQYFASCYFDTNDEEYYDTRYLAYYAKAYGLLNEIDRNAVLLSRGAHLKALAAYLEENMLDNGSQTYRTFMERYTAHCNLEDPDSLLSLLYAKANAYKAQIAEIFTEGYTGALDTEEEMTEIYDALATLVDTCHFPDKAYANDVVIVESYIGIYKFYTAFRDAEATEEEKIARNGLYKSAVALFNKNSSAISSGSLAYSQTFITLYTDLITKAGKEIKSLLDDSWIKIAKDCGVENEDGTYFYSMQQILDAYNALNTYYMNKATALYYGATEDKAKTAEVESAMTKVENRIIKEINDTLTLINGMVDIPENLAQIDADGLANRIAAQNELYAKVKDFTFLYAKEEDISPAYHKLVVGMMLSMVCEIELEFAKTDADSTFITDKFGELKTFAGDVAELILEDEKDYASYLLFKNKLDVKVGEAYIPDAREVMQELAAIVDEDNFDKVYALMHLDEFIRQSGITRPDASDTTSQTALFYQDYDVLANKVKAFRQAKVDEREANVTLSEYTSSIHTFYDMEKMTLGRGGGHKYVKSDTRHYGVDGAYGTFEYEKGNSADGYLTLPPAATKGENIIFEMYITTFDYWPTGGVSFNSAHTTPAGARIWPWLGALTASGQLQVPDGPGKRTVVTDREGGFIVPGQWTHLILLYNGTDKTVQYYINDEKIVGTDGRDKWSCALAQDFVLNEALRIGHAQAGGGSFSLDNVATYVGDTPRNVTLMDDMSELEKFAFYTDILKRYLDEGKGKVEDAKTSLDALKESFGRYWGIPATGDGDNSGSSGDGGLGDGSDGGDSGDGGESGSAGGAGSAPITPAVETYLFDESTYWDVTSPTYVDPGITYEEFKVAVDTCRDLLTRADAQLEGAMKNAVLAKLRTDIAALEGLAGIANLTARKTLLASIDNYIEENITYISALEGAALAEYETLLDKKAAVEAQIESYARADEYINMVNKFASAKDIYSRTVYRNQAQGLMDLMVRDDGLNVIDLDALKADVPEFVAAIERFEEESGKLSDAILNENNETIIDCMSRFPAVPEDAIKDYDRLNKYIVLVRRILLEGNYDPENLDVKEALIVYNKMNDLFYDALQKEHAKNVQDLIDAFNRETSYITRLGIYKAVKTYLEENDSVIDRDHESIKTILSQYEQMDERFGTDEGLEQEWEEYGEILKINAGKFATMVTEMRLCDSYAELGALRERAAALFYYMDATDAEAQLAIEYYLACESLLAQKALRGDIFIEAAYALSHANTMESVYAALLVAGAAYAEIDPTYDGVLIFKEVDGKETYNVEYTMTEAINQYLATLASYNSFVTVINAEVNSALDMVCSVRAGFAVNQPVVALFKKIYD